MIVEPVRVINVENRTYDVASLPQQCQTLVAFYNEWRQKEADLKSELLLTQAAVREISREIVQTIQVENAKTEASAATPPNQVGPLSEPIPVNDPSEPVSE